MSLLGPTAGVAELEGRVTVPGSSEYGVHDTLRFGFTSTLSQIKNSHPLEASERLCSNLEPMAGLAELRVTQGLHAPLRLLNELKVTRRAGRFPCLHSSGIGTATILGTDERIGFEDFLNDPGTSELMGEPHVMIERAFKLN
uniref:proteasome maturation protein n=1 Tax=Myxine glutinosa TaxID=7769 RepID=UPI00358E67C1